VELAREAAQAGYRNCISVGGDGTLHEVVNGIAEVPEGERPGVGVISMGTGGDFVRSLRERHSVPGDLEWLKRARKVSVDMGLARLEGAGHGIRKKYFINVADVGLSGEVVRRVNRSSKFLGPLEYVRSALVSAWQYRAPRVKITGFDSGRESGPREVDLLLFVAANGRYFGGGMCIAPDARFDDGNFQFLLVEKLSYLSFLAQFPKIYRSRRMNHPRLHYGAGRRVVIEAVRGRLPVDLDGEDFQADKVSFDLQAGAIEVLTAKGLNRGS
jgi:YegS/Rv2252/BmrU family lipid kinase